VLQKGLLVQVLSRSRPGRTSERLFLHRSDKELLSDEAMQQRTRRVSCMKSLASSCRLHLAQSSWQPYLLAAHLACHRDELRKRWPSSICPQRVRLPLRRDG